MSKLKTIMFIAFFIYYFFGYVIILPKALGTYSWQKVEGKIIDYDYIFLRYSKEIKIKYEYTINNELYISSNGTIGKFIEKPGTNSFQKYKPGNKVSVYYNTRNPAEAVLERGLNYRSIMMHFVFGWLLFIFIKNIRNNTKF